MYNEINEFFNEMGKAIDNACKEIKNPILVDVVKNDSNYVVYATLPGVSKEDVNLAFEDSKLTISVKDHKDEEETKEDVKYILSERIEGFNPRSIYLKNVDETKISAKYVDGILEITVPLKEKKVSNIVIE